MRGHALRCTAPTGLDSTAQVTDSPERVGLLGKMVGLFSNCSSSELSQELRVKSKALL